MRGWTKKQSGLLACLFIGLLAVVFAIGFLFAGSSADSPGNVREATYYRPSQPPNIPPESERFIYTPSYVYTDAHNDIMGWLLNEAMWVARVDRQTSVELNTYASTPVVFNGGSWEDADHDEIEAGTLVLEVAGVLQDYCERHIPMDADAEDQLVDAVIAMMQSESWYIRLGGANACTSCGWNKHPRVRELIQTLADHDVSPVIREWVSSFLDHEKVREENPR